MQGGLPIDLILFGMVAAFLVLRLRSVLGKRTGFERPPQERPAGYDPRGIRADAPQAPAQQQAAAPTTRHQVPDQRSATGQVLVRIQQQDRGFDPHRFLDGAEGAFRMIVQAFAAGDRATLKGLLSADSYAGFEQAISGREQAGETQRSEIRAMAEVGIDAAELHGTVAEITVRFISDQINMTTGRGGEVVTGSDAVTELTDLWTFQRDLSQQDPTWKLIATQSL